MFKNLLNRKKILLLNYTAEEANWGCKATSKGLLKIISKSYPSAYVKKRNIEFANPDMQYDIPKNPKKYKNYMANSFIEKELISQIKWADIIIFNGEGTMHEWSDINTRPEPHIRMIELNYAKENHPDKYIIATNQTVDYWSENFAGWIKKVFSKLDLIAVREPKSLTRLKKLGLNKTVLIPDAAFLTYPEKERKVKKFMNKNSINEGFIGIFFGEEAARSDVKKWKNFLKQLKIKYKRQLVLFVAPHVDVVLSSKLDLDKEDKVLGIEVYPELIVGILKNSYFVVSGRFHACIFTMIAGKLLIPLKSNTDKIDGILQMIDYAQGAYDFAEVKNKKIISDLDNRLKNKSKIEMSLKKKVDKIVKTTAEGFKITI